jgi:molybdopterin-guanine dinucleotide biosynthesis protein A
MIGVVMAGGESRRMGQDKALLEYHGKAQFIYLSELIAHFDMPVVVSSNSIAASQSIFQVFSDAPKYQNHGPISGLLSVHEQFPMQPLLVVGCDYPSFNQEALSKLIANRNRESHITAFVNADQIPEPLLAIYEVSALRQFQQGFLLEGRDSLRRFMMEIGFKAIEANDSEWIRSIDHWEDYQNWKKHHSSNQN